MTARIAKPLMLLPGALIVFLSFNAGGFFPSTQGFVVVLLLVALAAWIAFAERPLSSLSKPLAIACAALAALAAWTLLSSSWSESSARALLEFDRALLYLVTLLFFGLALRSPTQLRWLIWGLAAGITAVCVAALATRLMPDVWHVEAELSNERLSFPLTYWNALGLLAAIGVVLCLHLASRAGGARAPRVLAAAAVPILATTLYFTFSRGGILAVGIGLAIYVLVGRPRGLASGLLATLAPTGVALWIAYRADLLATPNSTIDAAATQGHEVALAVVVCAGGAAALRLALLALDRIVAARPPMSRTTRGRLRLGAGVAAVLALGLAVAADAPRAIIDEYEDISAAEPVGQEDFRERIIQVESSARTQQWQVAIDQFEREPVRGEGAATYAHAWLRNREEPSEAVDAHSLYLETLGELGIIGLVLLICVIGTVLVGFAIRARGPGRPTHAALLAVGCAWAAHAAIDWDWEMPAVTIWLFADGGVVLASLGRRPLRDFAPRRVVRPLVVIPILLLCAVPLKILSSQAWLQEGRDRFARGDCGDATAAAEASISALGSRPEPYELLGYCAIRTDDSEAAIRYMSAAVARDPHNWNFHYGLALAQASAGFDPRPAARTAWRLNPLDPLTGHALTVFDTRRPSDWRERGRFLAAQFNSL